ncbi:lipase family alpha/beta hydrolase [Streptomyces sp. NPDC096132]|uniref:lipase family alpha/beta hydrolase n=1 Tax=Streptomyces sp. NPDC096132 TaxID=3366075 RepID=UPI0037FE19B8
MPQETEPNLDTFTLGTPLGSVPTAPPAPRPDDTWTLPGGKAHVYYGQDNKQLRRPVIMADGFNLGPSDLDWLYGGLQNGAYPFVSELRSQGRDVILVGFEERSASLLDNARTVEAAIFEAIGRRIGDEPLVVGGFSMGGIITRYTLAKLETQRMDHQTRTYFSYDSPHRGAAIPIGLQAFSYFIPLPNDFRRQIESPAARQMLWRHVDAYDGEPHEDPLRTEFLDALRRVGSWPRIPRLLAVANGRGDGVGLPDLRPGDIALKLDRFYPGTTFYIQAQGNDVTVAELKRNLPPAQHTVKTSGFPELDGAPGGTLHSYKLLADALEKLGTVVDLRHEDVCFVPAVSAVSIRDLDRQDDLYAKIDTLDPAESDVDEFLCSSTTTAHTEITEELGSWLVDRF